jgi:chromosome segregation ATPase
MAIPWPNVLSLSFLVLFSVILWGTWQGFFSKRTKKVAAVPKETEDLCAAIKEENARLRARVFELENDLAAKIALIDELNRKIQELMNTINALTLDLDMWRKKVAELSALLKAALEDLRACRAELSKVKAALLAKQVQDAVCKYQPENANLLR